MKQSTKRFVWGVIFLSLSAFVASTISASMSDTPTLWQLSIIGLIGSVLLIYGSFLSY